MIVYYPLLAKQLNLHSSLFLCISRKLMAPSSSSSSSSTQFIDTALSSTTSPYALSYPSPKQKWIIRKHLISLINNYPTFRPSTDKFTHNDGTVVNILNAAGNLTVSVAGCEKYTPPVPLTIWVNENYPYTPPIVYVSPNNSISPVHRNHPFVDPFSGFTSTPYLQSWVFPRCNLTELVHNLVKIFSHDHPFFSSGNISCSPGVCGNVSKMEALDRLSGMIHYDLITLNSKFEYEFERLSSLKMELMNRNETTRNAIINLEQERLSLKKRVMSLMEQSDVVMNWVRVNNGVGIGEGDEVAMDDGFDGEDEESRLVIERLGLDRGIEDLMDALEKGLEEGVVSVDAYIRQIRGLGREQFVHRRVLLEVKGPELFLLPY
ncbi:protein ELC-like [Mercurialis annua]|uniref:protein ELC-like n=1 Tax=Mercurialis annua TaxID=3986 RepID=UPI0021609ABF|nr:protein ELC-like [Mercurialis annua]